MRSLLLTLSFAVATTCLVRHAPAQSDIWTNGDLVTHPGGGAGGVDASMLDNTAPMSLSVYGLGAQRSANNALADDFAVYGRFNASHIEFYVYQTNAVAPTITEVYCRILDGDPRNAASTVLWGDLVTNMNAGAAPIGTLHSYRVLIGALGATNRPVYAVRVPTTVHGPLALEPGVYWIEMQFAGDATLSGPWVPPATDLVERATGDAIQRVGATWAAINTALPTAPPAGCSVPFRLLGAPIAPAEARLSLHHAGKPGTYGVVAFGQSPLILGTTSKLQVVNGVPGTPPLLAVGLGHSDVPLAFGRLYVANSIATLFGAPFDANRMSETPIPVPSSSSLEGLELTWQAFCVDAGAVGGLSHTSGLGTTFGHHWTPAGIFVTVKVGETEWVSLGVGGTICLRGASANPGRATFACNNGVFRGGFDVTGVAAGGTTMTVRYGDKLGVLRTATVYVNVVP